VGKRTNAGACDQYFASNGAFSAHRVGIFGVDRRCLTVAEMWERVRAVLVAEGRTEWFLTEEE
jgi:hypothetical protein